MRKLLALCMLLLPLSQIGAQVDPLWQKAVEIARRNKPWIPGSTLVRLDLLDDKGVSTDSYETLMSIAPDGEGDPVTEVRRASHNGADVTAKEKETQEKRNRDARGKAGLGFTMGDNPFDPDLQSAVRASATGDTTDIGGAACAVFAFTMKKSDGSELSGNAALDRKSGAPRELTYTIKPLPMGVWTMTTVLRYSEGPAGEGFLREVSIDGTGGFLFIKRTFRSLITLEAYWKNGKS